MKHSYQLLISFHHKGDRSIPALLADLQRFCVSLAALSPHFREWLLSAGTKDEAYLYNVFEGGQPTPAALAVLTTKQKSQRSGASFINIWNGEEDDAGVSLSLMVRPPEHASLITLMGRAKAFPSDWRAVAEAVTAGASIWAPDYITVESNAYWEHKTFKDRPGVGWMLYLPRILTGQQVPEACSLVPVPMGDDRGRARQFGTVIVSVVDEPFSDENVDHVKHANAIEIRLADQDLLPRLGG